MKTIHHVVEIDWTFGGDFNSVMLITALEPQREVGRRRDCGRRRTRCASA